MPQSNEQGKWVICPCCKGEGKRDMQGVVDRDDFDDEEWAEYLDGSYDTPCSDCGGSGKMLATTADRLIRRTGTGGHSVFYKDADDASEHLLRMVDGMV
ncbi:hypothetical protein AB7849_15675 [Rhodanobacter sp. 115]|uniref:hypothetical protein n=1 Tax=Rhodanobacter sp. FW021-MT20 TaxID=1162282 RepID=UPI0034E42785